MDRILTKKDTPIHLESEGAYHSPFFQGGILNLLSLQVIRYRLGNELSIP